MMSIHDELILSWFWLVYLFFFKTYPPIQETLPYNLVKMGCISYFFYHPKLKVLFSIDERFDDKCNVFSDIPARKCPLIDLHEILYHNSVALLIAQLASEIFRTSAKKDRKSVV